MLGCFTAGKGLPGNHRIRSCVRHRDHLGAAVENKKNLPALNEPEFSGRAGRDLVTTLTELIVLL